MRMITLPPDRVVPWSETPTCLTTDATSGAMMWSPDWIWQAPSAGGAGGAEEPEETMKTSWGVARPGPPPNGNFRNYAGAVCWLGGPPLADQRKDARAHQAETQEQQRGRSRHRDLLAGEGGDHEPVVGLTLCGQAFKAEEAGRIPTCINQPLDVQGVVHSLEVELHVKGGVVEREHVIADRPKRVSGLGAGCRVRGLLEGYHRRELKVVEDDGGAVPEGKEG